VSAGKVRKGGRIGMGFDGWASHMCLCFANDVDPLSQFLPALLDFDLLG